MKRSGVRVGVLLAIFMAVVFVLTGCTKTTNSTHTKTVIATVAPGPSSTTTTSSTATNTPPLPGDCSLSKTNTKYSMLCPGTTPVTGALKDSPQGSVGVSSTLGFGIDTYNGGNPASGSFDFSYVPLDGKGWDPGQIQQWHNDGKSVGTVFESSSTRAYDGRAAGQSDGRYALDWANSVGMPSTVPIFFAVDTDATAAAVAQYFLGVHDILGGRTGAYGSYDVVEGLDHTYHLITPSTSWQTLAWSRGLVGDSCLYQRAIPEMNGTLINGAWVDLDTSRCTNFGQWPSVPLKPPPSPANPHHYKWAPNIRRTLHFTQVTSGGTSHFVLHARERLALQHWDKWGCRIPTRRVKCQVEQQKMQLLDARIVHIAHRTPNLKHRVRKARWGAIHYHAKDGHKTTLGGINQEFAHRDSRKNHGVVSHW